MICSKVCTTCTCSSTENLWPSRPFLLHLYPVRAVAPPARSIHSDHPPEVLSFSSLSVGPPPPVSCQCSRATGAVLPHCHPPEARGPPPSAFLPSFAGAAPQVRSIPSLCQLTPSTLPLHLLRQAVPAGSIKIAAPSAVLIVA